LKSILFHFIFLFSITLAFSQQTEEDKLKEIFSISGYVKYLKTYSYNEGNFIGDNLIHNRVRLKANFSSELTAVFEMRNRIFYGDITNNTLKFGELLDQDSGQFDLSFNTLNTSPMVFNTIFDRAYLRYSAEKYQITLGRQRINWGVNLAWSPNDLFNAYSLLDFDYQERAGADALRFQYYTGDMSSIDLSIQPGDGLNQSIIGFLWKFNKWERDFQILAGNYFDDFVIGYGSEGTIFDKFGFKREVSYFIPKNRNKKSVTSMSTSIDYFFKNGVYLNTSLLYNTNSENNNLQSDDLFQSIIGSISVKNLMPSKWSYFFQVSGPFNPALNGSLSAFYIQGIETLVMAPTLTYEIEQNWEIMLLTQSAYGKIGNDSKNIGAASFYLRLMRSF
tara:strand:- start:719 stop:1891 length:1173 start_codon:yes stop_codon:yes gene_type:complete